MAQNETVFSPVDRIIQDATCDNLMGFILMKNDIPLSKNQISFLDLSSDNESDKKMELHSIFLERLETHLNNLSHSTEQQSKLSEKEQNVLKEMTTLMKQYAQEVKELSQLEKESKEGDEIAKLNETKDTKTAELDNLTTLAEKRGIADQSSGEIFKKIDNGFNKYLFIFAGPLTLVAGIVTLISGASLVGIPVAVLGTAFLYSIYATLELNKDYEMARKIEDLRGEIGKIDKSINELKTQKNRLVSEKTNNAEIFKKNAHELASTVNPNKPTESSSLEEKISHSADAGPEPSKSYSRR